MREGFREKESNKQKEVRSIFEKTTKIKKKFEYQDEEKEKSMF